MGWAVQEEPPELKVTFLPPRAWHGVGACASSLAGGGVNCVCGGALRRRKFRSWVGAQGSQVPLLPLRVCAVIASLALPRTAMATVMQKVKIYADLSAGHPPQLQFPRQLPILLHGRVSQSEFEQVLLLAEIPFNQALSEFPSLSDAMYLPCCMFPKLFQAERKVFDASAKATEDVAAESARTFEPRGVQFSFVEREVGKHSRTEYSIIAHVMPGASSTTVDTSLMPPAPYTATPTGEHTPLLK